jgi:hypothetical protein
MRRALKMSAAEKRRLAGDALARVVLHTQNP